MAKDKKKDYETLEKKHKFELEQLQKIKNQYLQAIEQAEQIKKELRDQMQHEQNFYASHQKIPYGIDAYIVHNKVKIEIQNQEISALQKQIDALDEDIFLEFSERQKYKHLKEQEISRLQREIDKKNQADMDETALVRFKETDTR